MSTQTKKARIISVSSTKGGPGKTTMVACLADCWASQGYSVAILDTDPNTNMSNWYNKGRKKDNFQNVELVTEKDEDNIISQATDLARIHDILIIDVAGVGSRSLLYASGIADLVIIPAQPNEDDFMEAVKTKRMIENAANMTGRKIKFRTLLNRAKLNTMVLAHTAKQLEKNNFPLFDTVMRDRTVFQKSRYSGTTPIHYEPRGVAAQEIQSLSNEISEIIGLPNIADYKEAI